MDNREIERLAYMGVELPPELDYAEALYFLMLRAACETMKQTNMPPEQAKREKSAIDIACKKYRQDRDYAIHCGKMHNAASMATCDYRKAESKDEALSAADRIVEALDNVSVKHHFNKRQTTEYKEKKL